MDTLTVNIGGTDFQLHDGDVRFLLRDGSGLTVSEVGDDDPARQLGSIVPLLDHWFFRADSVPAARVLRIDGTPVANVRQQLPTGHTVTFGLVSDTATGPINPRPAAAGVVAGPPGRPPAVARGDRPPRGSTRYVIGRAGTHPDIPIDDPLVQARHASVRIDAQGRWWISGEVFVGGVRQLSVTLSDGDVFVIGQTSVTVSPDLLPGGARVPATPSGVREVRPGARRRPTTETGLEVRLDAVTVHGHDNKLRLDNVTLAIAPGEVVAVVGPSGAGKSSLIQVLMGELAEEHGTVRVGPAGGRTDPELRRKQVRYVPQGDEDLYKVLTVRETLTYAARLRGASDSSAAEIGHRVDEVLGRLSLDRLDGNPVGKISGGQRRRVSIGTELVGKPQLLLLDEPTSGLDPGKDRAIMTDLRDVAETYHCTIVIVTHATEHLGFVDKVVVMARGGRVRDAGPPATVLRTLNHASWADLMDELDADPPAATDRAPAPSTSASRRPAPALKPTLTGLATLLHREFTLTRRRGRGSLAVLVGVPAICTLLAVAASGRGLRPGAEMAPVLAILVTVAALTGASLTYPDIVNDSEKLRRDWRVGIEALPMVVAKAVVYSGLCAVLAGLVAVLFTALRDLPPAVHGVPPFVMLYLVVLMTMLSSMGLGLLISAFSPSLERAVTFSTLLAVLQVALSGTLFHLGGRPGLVTAILPARLGLAAAASYADLNHFRRPALYTDWLWNPGGSHFWAPILVLAAVFAVATAGSVLFLHRRWTR